MALNKIWVFAEAEDDKVTTPTLELLTKAREIASAVEAIYAGSSAEAVATTVGDYGATKLHVIDPAGGLPGQIAAAGIAHLASEQNPDAILFAQSYDGRDALARLSAKLDRPVLTNGMSLDNGDGLTFGTAIFGGVTLATPRCWNTMSRSSRGRSSKTRQLSCQEAADSGRPRTMGRSWRSSPSC